MMLRAYESANPARAKIKQLKQEREGRVEGTRERREEEKESGEGGGERVSSLKVHTGGDVKHASCEHNQKG